MGRRMETDMNLSDTQRMILAAAAARPDRMIAPPPSPPAPRAQIARKFLKLGLAEEAVVPAGMRQTLLWGAGVASGLRITDEGMRAIGADPEDTTAADDATQHAAPDMEIEAAFDPITGTAGAAPQAAATVATPTPAEQRRGIASRAVRKAAGGKRAEAEAAADRGELPQPPDFSASTHAPYRARLAKLIQMAEAGDVAGLRGMQINPTSTSPKALIRYRDLAVRALEAEAKATRATSRPGDAAAIYAEEHGVPYAEALIATNTD
jgi:hypothetical protein